jgi:hypothetical protein
MYRYLRLNSLKKVRHIGLAVSAIARAILDASAALYVVLVNIADYIKMACGIASTIC